MSDQHSLFINQQPNNMLRPGEVRSLLDRMAAAVGTPAMAELDREMTPILAELVALGPENKAHPTVKQLFNWLVDSKRTGEEFNYVIGPLHRHVLTITQGHLYSTFMGQEIRIQSKYLGKVAAEALAMKCPILDGPWEIAGWILVMENSSFSTEDYGPVSDCLSSWILHVINDPDLCPNPYLRIELMILLYVIVDLKDHNRTQALESLLSACSSLNIDYLLESKAEYGQFHQMDFEDIIGALNNIGIDVYQEFDEKLSKKLLNVKTSRLSAIVHDVAYNCTVNPNIYAHPMALHGVTALLKTIAGFIRLNYKDYYDQSSNWDTLIQDIDDNTDYLHSFTSNFRKSCQTPQLCNLTASCLMDVMELAIFVNENYIRSRQSLDDIEAILGELFGENPILPVVNFPVGLELICKYKERLRYLKLIMSRKLWNLSVHTNSFYKTFNDLFFYYF